MSPMRGALGTPGPRPPHPAFRRVVHDLKRSRASLNGHDPLPGRPNFSVNTTWRARHDVLNLLLESYYRYGPIFDLKILHDHTVFMLGPEANHFVLVSGRDNFSWRQSHFSDLITLLGDGLLTIDGEYHDSSREIMMPSFHRDRVIAATEVMRTEISTALDRLEPGQSIDLYEWTRELAMRIAMQALFGFEPGSDRARETAAWFEQGLRFHGAEYVAQLFVGPKTPYAKLVEARRALERELGEEITARRASGEDRGDILGSLLAAEDAEGNRFTDTQVLDHVMTLLFAGHDTTTATVTFLSYLLAKNPDWFAPLANEGDEVVGPGRLASAEQLFSGLPLLTQAIDETLRLYPPAWIGPRHSVKDFEFKGVQIPAGLSVAYSSWASHRLPDVWEDPHSFKPERFEPEARAKLPKGAYVPFGMGPRVCIGKRFGYTEVHAIASALLSRFRWELDRPEPIKIEQAPTLNPKGGMRVRVIPR